MPRLPDSGPLDMNDIAGEFGGTTPHSLSEYYRNGGYTTSNNTSVPTSGAISIGNFYNCIGEIIILFQVIQLTFTVQLLLEVIGVLQFQNVYT